MVSLKYHSLSSSPSTLFDTCLYIYIKPQIKTSCQSQFINLVFCVCTYRPIFILIKRQEYFSMKRKHILFGDWWCTGKNKTDYKALPTKTGIIYSSFRDNATWGRQVVLLSKPHPKEVLKHLAHISQCQWIYQQWLKTLQHYNWAGEKRIRISTHIRRWIIFKVSLGNKSYNALLS